MEVDKHRFSFPDNNTNSIRKERTASFKPFSYNKDNEKSETSNSAVTMTGAFKSSSQPDDDQKFMNSIRDRINKKEENEQQSSDQNNYE